MGMLGTIGQLGTGRWPQPSPHRFLDNVDATMSILDISMLTGFSPDLQDLKRVSAGTRGQMGGAGGDTGHLCAIVSHRVPTSPLAPSVFPVSLCPHILICPCVPPCPRILLCHCVPVSLPFPPWPHVPWCHCVPTSLQVPCILPRPRVPACPMWPPSLCPYVPLYLYIPVS